MARKSKGAGSPRAADEARDVKDELVASGAGSDDEALLAEGEPVGAWSDDEDDEETVVFDAALEDDEEIEEESDVDEEVPAGYQAASTEVDHERKRR